MTTEFRDCLDCIDIEFCDLESKLLVFLLFNGVATHILLERVDILCDTVRVLLDVAVSFEPEIIWFPEDDQILGGVADFVL